MSTTIKPIKLYGGILGPNPLKTALILTALEVPFESILIPFDQLKQPEYEAINPNGRLPSIHDPNTGLTVWESGAIIEYLIEQYDSKEPRKLSFAPRGAEAQLARSFLYLQVTGQGPYYGQAYWFKNFHHEKLPSAVERYVNEIKRVTGVLDKWLSQQKEAHKDNIGDGPWLVGNKLSYADLAFISWQRIAQANFADDGYDVNAFPHAKDWLERMTLKESLGAVLEEHDTAMAKARQAHK
ncbi:glutathione S-transferase Ure2-like, putative [Talaromyces stipitatus ATCC 10500]|uniref:Glutathione S-transferase Ure2-like, putative n=1 Tax=Talaromyces stipitatus (strain ATCC 10500 / CBS 375.48 / QM 6759 / NRRL 1006) TaxID=441959 RepID=B8MCJ3_TALSN|nr:glutathione S-transferase Ure2-like, putative [Talaromyces stipitatus ATCC 10500]EED18809.1 glutathione S-transferase Ure2-like, putative [Talaromyces stipitatus ATCC 10500]